MTNVPIVDVKPKGIIRLPHHVDELIPSQNHQKLLVAGRQMRKQSVVSADLKVRKVMVEGTGWAEGGAVDNDGRFLAVKLGRNGGLMIKDLSCDSCCNVPDATTVDACCFDQVGRLWAVHHLDSEVVIEVFDSSSNWIRVGAARFAICSFDEDHVYDFSGHSWVSLCGFNGGNVLVVTNDKNGAKTYLASLEDGGNEITLEHLPGLKQKCSLAAAIHGEVIGVDGLHAERAGFQKTSFPFRKVIQQCAWPEPRNKMGWRMYYKGCFIDWVNVLVASSSRRFFVLHTRSMAITREIRLEGLREGGTSHYFDLPTFERCGDSIMVLAAESKPKRAQLMVLDAEELVTS